jgi:hypothetical protein
MRDEGNLIPVESVVNQFLAKEQCSGFLMISVLV